MAIRVFADDCQVEWTVACYLRDADIEFGPAGFGQGVLVDIVNDPYDRCCDRFSSISKLLAECVTPAEVSINKYAIGDCYRVDP
jgi:hypothetical protein